jgi:hypothetical protein
MTGIFKYIRPGLELVKVNFTWNAQMPFLQTTNDSEEIFESPFFYSHRTPGHQWKLALFANTEIIIQLVHYDSEGQPKIIIDPVLVEMAILNKKGEKVHRKMLLSEPHSYYYVLFELSKEEILKSECQQVDGSYTFYCTIRSHLKKELESPDNLQDFVINCSEDELSTQLEDCIIR